jgi:hypothetical protein
MVGHSLISLFKFVNIYFPIPVHLLKNVLLAVLLLDPVLRFVPLFDLREPRFLRPPVIRTLSFFCSNKAGLPVLDTAIGGNNVVEAFTEDDIIYSVYIMYIKNIS